MQNIELLVILLFFTSILAVFADRIRVSYPILLVLAGLVISFIPGLPSIELKPEIVFILFLPPLLYAAAWTTSWHDFKRAKRPISLLSIGLVVFTSTVVAFVSHWLIPGFSLAQGYLLGGIISPPDAVAATSVFKGLNVPKRVVTILEGESLVNDASGLIVYRYALSAIITGQFILWQASLQFVLVATMGIIIGLAVGYVVYHIHKLIHGHAAVDTAITLISPYFSYLLAEHFHFSGVLAVVTTGLFLSWYSSDIFTHETRIQANAVWNTLIFVLNGVVFIIIGLQLPHIITRAGENCSVYNAIGYGLVISLVTIVVRLIWMYPGAYLPRILSKRIRTTEDRPKPSSVFIIGWAGMRGIVSLAAALAIPLTLQNGQPFPGRDMILFITFCVILVTLVLQGLSLPLLVKKLKVQVLDEDSHLEKEVRLKLAYTAISHIEENFSYQPTSEAALAHIKNKYEFRVDQLNGRVRNNTDQIGAEEVFKEFHKMQSQLITIERKLIKELKKEGKTSEEIIRKLENEIDLEESSLKIKIT